MKINRNNYELYFLDYLDGNLSEPDILLLEDFLLINPDLRAELEGIEKTTLSPENIDFEPKELLLQPDLSLPVNENNIQDFCIAGSEGDLNEEQQMEFSNYRKTHPESENLLKFFSSLRLSPDKNIEFSDKGKLKRSVFLVPRRTLYPILSMAAAISLMIIVYVQYQENYKKITLSSKENPVEVIKEEKKVRPGTVDITEQVIASNTETTPKEKKKMPSSKAALPIEKKIEQNKNKEGIQPQKLNPSFQIKLPSAVETKVVADIIERGKIKYEILRLKQENSPEYLSLSEFAKKQLNEKVPVSKDISAWQVADAGIKGINKLTGGDMKLEKRINEEGRISNISFNSKLLSFYTTK